MPLVSYGRAWGMARSEQPLIPQLTVPLPKYNGPKPGTLFQRSPSGLPIIVAVLVGVAPALHAQRVTGPWEDATIAARGVLRIGISPRWEQWKERHDASGQREPLGAAVSTDGLGGRLPFVSGARVPFVAGLAPALSVLSGLPSPPLSLGALRTRLDATQALTQISLEYGLTPRIGLQALIPYVKNRVHVLPIVNQGAIGATIGFNPALAFAGARQQNGLVVTTIGTAATRLSGELTRCLGSADPTCTAINADRSGALALVQLASQVSGALGSVYGTATTAGALYAPVAGSPLHSAIDARLTTLNTQFRTFLGAPTSGEWITGRPVAAVPMAAADLDELLGGDAAGILARPLGDYEHSHVGDIEVGAKYVLLDTFGPPAISPLPGRGAMRLAVAGVYRLGTGQLDLPDDFTDIGTGDRQADLELRGLFDFAFGPRLWMSSVFRLGIQRPDRAVRRIPSSVADVFPEAVTKFLIRRDLGDAMELEFAPRYVPNDEFSISARYRYRSKGLDAYTGTFPVNSVDGTPMTLDASVLGTGTEQKEHQVGFAVTYSTVRANSRGSAKWPLEVSLLHTQVMSGSGIPRIQMNGVALRLYRPGRANPVRMPAR